MQKQVEKNNLMPSSLPHNRKEQFKDIVRHRFMLMVLTSLMVFAGFFPAIALYSWTVHISDVNVFSSLISNLNISQEMLSFSYFWVINICYLLLIPLLIIGSLFLCGAFRIYRLLAWNDGIFFFSDFFEGIKKNFKYGILIGLFLGLLFFLSKFIGGSITLYVDGNIGYGVEIFLKATIVGFFLPICFILLLFTTYFDDKFINYIKNCFYIYISKIWAFLLLSLFLLIIYVLPFISNIYLIIITIVLLMIFVLPFYLLLWNQTYLGCIDVYSNDEQIKLKGLYRPSNK